MNQKHHHLDSETYTKMYAESINSRDDFWSRQADSFLRWFRTWDTVYEEKDDGTANWFKGGLLNVSYNCIDRHIETGHGEQVAYYWESNEGNTVTITYNTLRDEVSKLANVLKGRGVKKGDRVCIYMPMIPEAVYAMLACTRIGAVHTVVFGGFSSESLRLRITDTTSSVIITTDVAKRGDKYIPLKEQVDKIIGQCPSVHTSIILQTIDTPITLSTHDIDYKEAVSHADTFCEPVEMDSEDPLFILYTSGSTGKPKGVVHTTGGYLLYVSMTFKYVFDHKESDVFWCTADIGWITGHSYVVYGPLSNRASSVIYEGVPLYPNASRVWNIIDKYNVSIFYTAPTLIRTLMGQGDNHVLTSSRKSLRILGTVGESINQEAWHWYRDTIGRGECTIVDTWWQTETGGHAIVPIPGTVDPKPGAAMLPFFGVIPTIVNEEGQVLEGEAEGILLLKGAWPSYMRGLYNDHARFIDTYRKPYPGYHFTGDGVKRDIDGHYWITGRIDDVIKVSGHLISTTEVENSLLSHPSVNEVAVIGIPDAVKGSHMVAFVCLKKDAILEGTTTNELLTIVKERIGSFAKPDAVFIVQGLPKTQSGKIMRRILRKIAIGDTDDIGDTSTLIDAGVVHHIIQSIAASKENTAA